MADDLQSAMAHHKAGRFAEAEATYRALLQQQPNEPRLMHLLGTALLQRRQFDESIRLLQKASAAAPQQAEIHFTLGDALRHSGNPAAAEAAYRKAISARALFPQAHNGLGLSLSPQQKYESAGMAWQRAIQHKG